MNDPGGPPGPRSDDAGRPQPAEHAPSRWDAPVIYLREFPAGTDVSPYGIPYYLCERCEGRLAVLADPAAQGTMLICIYRCGQRFWVDRTDGGEPR